MSTIAIMDKGPIYVSAAAIDRMIKTAQRSKLLIDKAVGTWESGGFDPSAMASTTPKVWWLHIAMLLQFTDIANKSVVIFGSTDPNIETMAAAYEAKEIYTLEYNNLTFNRGPHDIPMTTINQHGFEDFYLSHTNYFDAAFSISSFDHDGLGRYGDPLDPNGDITAMRKTWSVLKPGGILFLTVPIGPDVVVFNLHRRYGQIRLLLLLEGWEVLHKVAWEEERLTEPANWRQTYEPVFVLRKPNEAEDNKEEVVMFSDEL